MEPSVLDARILVVGSDGMLGRAWVDLLERTGRRFSAVDRPALDLREPAAIDAVVGGDHGIVVNCAAWTDVDGAETHEAEALAINGESVARLAARCHAVGSRLVHYGTDYVFDGAAIVPYAVDAPHRPLGAYGRGKAAGERAVLDSPGRTLLIRTSWLYARWGRNFVRTIAAALRERPVVKVVDDQRGRPSLATAVAASTLGLLDRDLDGVFHVTDGGSCTWFELATAIAEHVPGAGRVEPCTTAEYPLPAPRPRYSVLDLSATEAVLGPTPSWRERLAETLREPLP